MATSRIRVELRDQASLQQASSQVVGYEVTLDVGGQHVGQETIPIDPKTGLGLTEFLLTAPGKGRLTIEKPSNLHASRLPSARVGNIPLDDVYEYNVSIKGQAPAFQLIPEGFKGGKVNELIGEVVLTFEPGEDGAIITTFSLTIEPIPEFFEAETAKSGPAPAPKKGDKERFRPVAYFIPGTDRTKRALIISGVHGSEPEGVRTAEKVLGALFPGAKDGVAVPELGAWTPKFDTVIVTAIIPRTQPPRDRHKAVGDPKKERLVNRDRNDRNPQKKRIEPNRNLPFAGKVGQGKAVSYAEARQRARVQSDRSELEFVPLDGGKARLPVGEKSSWRLIPENRLLLALVERFRPQRLASIHSHTIVRERGNSFGIFVDPRGGFDPVKDVPLADKGKDDDRLARTMVCAFEHLRIDRQVATQNDPLLGNKQTFTHAQVKAMNDKAKEAGKEVSETPLKLVDTLDAITVHYDPKIGAAVEGNSLGMWAPEEVAELSMPGQRGRRKGITTVTVELPHGELGGDAIQKIENLHAEVLVSIFLEGTKASASPPSGEPGSTGQKGKTPTPPKTSGKVWPALKGCPDSGSSMGKTGPRIV